MVKRPLVESLIRDGVHLLHELDRQGFQVQSMFWLHMAEEDYWRLIIGSPIAGQGPAATYTRLGELLAKIRPASIRLSDISVLDPNSHQFRNLLSQASTSGRIAAGSEWDEYEDAIFYRWTDASVTCELSCDVSHDDLNRFLEAEARDVNMPTILFGLDGRRVTLRPHPQHGPMKHISGIKTTFEIAIHRPGARPDCQVRWLN